MTQSLVAEHGGRQTINDLIDPNDAELQLLELRQLRLDGNTKPRYQMSDDILRDLNRRMSGFNEEGQVIDRERIPFTPLSVFFDGENYWLADGYHRYRCATDKGYTTFQCHVYEGTLRDALRYSLSANARHGKKRTNADKRYNIEKAFQDEEWKDWSDARIAKLCSVSTPTVGKIRRLLEEAGALEAQEMRRGADGRMYPRASEQRAVAGKASVRVRRRLAGIPDPEGEEWTEEQEAAFLARRSHRDLLEHAKHVNDISHLDQTDRGWIDILLVESASRRDWYNIADKGVPLLHPQGLLIIPNTTDLPHAISHLMRESLQYLGGCYITKSNNIYHVWGNRDDVEFPVSMKSIGRLLKKCHPSHKNLILVQRTG